MTYTLFLLKLICYLLSLVLIIGSCLIISSFRLIYSIFSLVLVFFSGIWFFILYDAEYALFIFLVVYLGAVVIFFIFVIMLLSPSLVNQQTNISDSQILIVLISTGLAMLGLFFLVKTSFSFGPDITNVVILNSQINTIYPMSFTNIEKIGLILYTDFGILLVLVGFLLFVVILGCVLILKPIKKNQIHNKKKMKIMFTNINENSKLVTLQINYLLFLNLVSNKVNFYILYQSKLYLDMLNHIYSKQKKIKK